MPISPDALPGDVSDSTWRRPRPVNSCPAGSVKPQRRPCEGAPGLGGFFFGAPFILEQAEEFVAELLTIGLVLLASPVLFLFYLLSAPAAMWRRDQEIIGQLPASLIPALQLTFDERCLRYVPRGRITPCLS
jgi:hypothetical protein